MRQHPASHPANALNWGRTPGTEQLVAGSSHDATVTYGVFPGTEPGTWQARIYADDGMGWGTRPIWEGGSLTQALHECEVHDWQTDTGAVSLGEAADQVVKAVSLTSDVPSVAEVIHGWVAAEAYRIHQEKPHQTAEENWCEATERLDG